MRVKGKIKRKKVVRFGFEAGGTFFEATDEASQKMFAALGIKKAFSTPLKMEFGVYDFKIAESGIPATVQEILNYGTEKFLKCRVGETTVYVNTDKDYSGDICLSPDFEKVGIVETERDIKII